ncbi:hypothetical protein ABPG77_003804 [Micractinium sp. CCAP 211/92]
MTAVDAAFHTIPGTLGASATAAASGLCCRRGLLQHAPPPADPSQGGSDFGVPTAAVWGLAGAVFLFYLVVITLCWRYCCRPTSAAAGGRRSAARAQGGSGGSTGSEPGKGHTQHCLAAGGPAGTPAMLSLKLRPDGKTDTRGLL